MPDTPHLDQIKSPDDLKNRNLDFLKAVADELRAETIDAVSVTGGHLGAGLGVVEMTVALHHVFDTPSDILIWDRYITELTEGKEAITVERQHMLLEIFDAVKTHPVALKLIKAGIPEVSGYWHDEEFDLKCKFRTDWINEKGYIVELKSTTDARKRKFFYKIKDMRYDIGAAWYVRGYKKLMNNEPKGYVWMVVETKAPFSVALYTPDESLLSAGEFGWDGEDAPVGFREALEVFKKARESGAYPGFQTQVETMHYKSYEKIY